MLAEERSGRAHEDLNGRAVRRSDPEYLTNWLRCHPRASIACMATITIRQLDEVTKKRLRLRAADHGRSMEEEAREILRSAVAVRAAQPSSLVDSIRRRFEAVGWLDLPEFPRKPLRQPPRFDE